MTLREQIIAAIAECRVDLARDGYGPVADAALAAIEASGPTEEMLRAGHDMARRLDCPITFVALRSVFRAMLAARPKP